MNIAQQIILNSNRLGEVRFKAEILSQNLSIHARKCWYYFSDESFIEIDGDGEINLGDCE